jgi:hypothetical protein
MKKNLIGLMFLGIISAFTGCAGFLGGWGSSSTNSDTTFLSPAVYRAKQEKWIGKDVNELILVLGPPSSTFTMPNGNIMYTWLTEDKQLVSEGGGSANAFGNAAFSNGWSVQHELKNSCRTSFTAEKSIVVAFNYEGNMCLAPEPVQNLFATVVKGDTVHLVLDGGREVTKVLVEVNNDWVVVGSGVLTESIPLKAVRKVDKVAPPTINK